jgi:hypothetical protein
MKPAKHASTRAIRIIEHEAVPGSSSYEVRSLREIARHPVSVSSQTRNPKVGPVLHLGNEVQADTGATSL